MELVEGSPELDEVKAWLGIEDTQDDVVLSESLDAALAAQRRICVYPLDETDTEVFDADLREAVFLRTQRLAARRNSPEGVIGLSGGPGDFVSAVVPSFDSDIAHLEGPYRVVVVA